MTKQNLKDYWGCSLHYAGLNVATLLLEAERDRKVLLEEVLDVTPHCGGLHPISIMKNEIRFLY